MNKKRFLLILILCSFSTVLGFLEIRQCKGNILVYRKNAADTIWVKDSIFKMDTSQILCAKDSSGGKILWANGTWIRFKENTVLQYKNDHECELQNGLIFVSAASDSSHAFVLHTPEVKVTVKGTGFAVNLDASVSTSIAVTDGILELQSRDGMLVQLEKGQKIKKLFGSPFGPPMELSPSDKESLAKLQEGDSISKVQPPMDSVKQAPADSLSRGAKSSPESLSAKKTAADTAKKAETKKEATPQAAAAPPEKPAPAQSDSGTGPGKEAEEKAKLSWEIGFGTVTIDGKQWQRINVSPDIPIWKFGLCLDVEFFIDDQGNFSNKGWQFEDATQTLESIARKIRYVRFGHSGDPFFIKLGALDNVALGYGLVMSGFRNTFEYPDIKKLGVQMEINNLSALKLGLATVVQNLPDIKNQASVVGLRLSLKPLSPLSLPLFSKMELGFLAAGDENQYKGIKDSDNDGLPNSLDAEPYNGDISASLITLPADEPDSVTMDKKRAAVAEADRIKGNLAKTDRFAVWGMDIGLPLLESGVLGLTVYGQYAMDYDFADPSDTLETKGFGIAAPGFLFKAGPANGNIEFRHLSGRFLPSYFNSSYEQDRILLAGSTPIVKENTLDSLNVNGIFASLGLKIGPVAQIGASYQHLFGSIGKLEGQSERGLTAEGSLGDLIVRKIPKLQSATIYYQKSRIGRSAVYDTAGSPKMENGEAVHDAFFEKSPYMIYGYRIGFELSKGIILLWDRRTVYVYDEKMQLISQPRIYIQTAIRF